MRETRTTVVVIYPGNGDGTFKTGVITGGIPPSLRSIAVGDFNSDGRLDIAAASDCLSSQDCTSGSLTILLGNGDGTFSPSAPVPLGGIVSQANTITVGDFNADGKLDIAVGVACYNIPLNGCSVGAISIFLGNGDGTFSAPTAYTTVGNGALFPAVADFNRDGKLDIVAGSPYAPNDNAHSSLTILLGNGDGTFTQQLFQGQPAEALPFYGLSAVAAVDLNSDSKPDLAITNGASSIQVMTGNGDGTFQAPVNYSTNLGNSLTNGAAISVVDLNGDGKPDLVVSGALTSFNGVQVFLNDGVGNLIPRASYTAGGWLYALIDVGDFNRDGKTDLLVVSGCAEDDAAGGELCPDGTLTMLLGNGDGTLRGATYVSPGNRNGQYTVSVAAADFNADGFQDLLVPGGTGNGFTLLLSNGAGEYQTPLYFASPASQPMFLTVGDFNGDGQPDVAVFEGCDQTCTGEAVSVFLNTGNGTFANAIVYESGGTSMAPQAITTGDFNGDGKTDIALLHCCTSTGQNLVGILLGNGDGTFQTAVTSPVGDGSGYWMAPADFNGDGKTDLVIAENPYNQGGDPVAGAAQILISKGDGTFTDNGSYPTGGDRTSGTNGGSITTGDVNGDGKADIVIGNRCDPSANDQNCVNGEIGVLIGNGDGSFTSPIVGSAIPDANFTAISLADVNGDGKLDVIASTLTGIYVALGNGDGTFQPGTIYAALRVDQTVQLAVAPLNTDGALDIVQPGDNGQLAILYQHSPTKETSTTTITSNTPNPSVTGQGVTVNYSVTGSGTPTGSVTVADNAGDFCTATVAAGSCTLTPLTAGVKTLMAFYSGDNDFKSSTSAGVSQTVNKAATTTTLVSNLNPSLVSQAVTFTATVTFKQGATTLKVVSLGSGQASYTTTYSTSGTRSITATYSGDGNFFNSTAATLKQVVNKVSTTTAVTSSQNPSTVGQAVTFTATVTSNNTTLGLPSPTGIVTFKNGTTTLGTGTLSGGVASLTTSSLPAGTQSITAVYGGDTNYSGSTSPKLSQVINGLPTTTTLSSSLNPSVYGQSVMFTATVTPNSGTGVPTGSVTFKSGTTTLAKVSLTSGTATYSTAVLTVGTKSITALYSGDATYATSTSAVLSQVISKATTTTLLTSSPNPSTSGQSVTFTATVTPQYSGTPTGTVTFKLGTTTLKTVTMSGGVASYSTSTLPTGSDTINAIYNGSASFNGSSNSITQTVNP
jgi:hypothetical protein